MVSGIRAPIYEIPHTKMETIQAAPPGTTKEQGTKAYSPYRGSQFFYLDELILRLPGHYQHL